MKNIKELNDEELKKVTGGVLNPGTPFAVNNAYPNSYNGEWFAKLRDSNFAYTVCTAGKGNDSFVANKYWYKNGEVWPCGTCSFGWGDDLIVIQTTTIIHTETTYDNPF